MMDLRTIELLSERAARESRERGDTPHIFMQKPEIEDLHNIPMLGNRVPRGWRPVSPEDVGLPAPRAHSEFRGHTTYFVDSSGFGNEHEPALTIDEFLRAVDYSGNYGYGIVEAGEFQISIALFERGHNNG